MMGPGEAIAAFSFFGFLIALVIAGTSIIKRWLSLKERQLSLTADRTAEKAAQYASHVEQLEARVRVLERIATDKGADLAQQIEDLRADVPQIEKVHA
jgi:hypothetical protein